MATLTVHGSEFVTEELDLNESLDCRQTCASYSALEWMPDTIITPISVTRTSNPLTMSLMLMGRTHMVMYRFISVEFKNKNKIMIAYEYSQYDIMGLLFVYYIKRRCVILCSEVSILIAIDLAMKQLTYIF